MRRECGERRGDRAVRVGRLPDAVPFAVDLQEHNVLGTLERQREPRALHAREAAGGKRRHLSVLSTDSGQPLRRNSTVSAMGSPHG